MKKVFLSLALVIMASLASAQSLSTVEGIWGRGKIENVKLFAIENGNYKELASSKVGEDGRFILAFYPSKEGFYALGLSTSKRHSYNFYFKPGDKLSVKITDTTYELTGKDNTPENKEMARWEELVAPLEAMLYRYSAGMTTYVDYFPLLEQQEKEIKKYKAKSTSNKVFNEVFAKYKELNLIDLATSYLFLPRPAHPQGEDYPDFYRAINMEKFVADPFILSYPEGLRLLSQLKMVKIWTSDDLDDETKRKLTATPEGGILDNEELMNVADPMVRAELVLAYSKNKKILLVLDQYIDSYAKYLVTDAQKKRLADERLPLIKNAKGDPAIDFAFADANGKTHALSDFKGKVVYVDVWATWCAPCKKELPELKKLEEEYKDNKNIVFIGVSVDKAGDMQKWKDFVAQENLPGVQLFAGAEANDKLMGPYKIKGIPRFILVGKDGNLIFADAPRPSSAEIRTVLNDALK